MTPPRRGIVLALVHVAIVASLGAKLLYDRATLPRVWARAVPVDPSLPIRGRYVRLSVQIEGTPRIVAFFIPENAEDPSRRAPGEELWAEVTMSPNGAPRPIQLAVKKSDGTMTPLRF
jgi:hypothetical protein